MGRKMKFLESIIKFVLKKYEIKKCEIVDKQFSTVCFFSNTAIGDTIFNTPVFRAFKAKYPHVKTIALLNPKSAILFRDDPNIDEIITYSGRWSEFLKTVRILEGKKIDIVFIMHSNEPQATPLAVMLRAKYIFKLPNLKNDFREFHSNMPQKYENAEQYVVLNRLKQLEFVGIKSTDTRLALFLNDDDFAPVDKVIKRGNQEKIIGFQMGANSRSRQWTKTRWSELAQLILANKEWRIVLSGAPHERVMTDEFCTLFKDEVAQGRILNLAGVFTLRSAAALIARLDIFITPDTGPLHIAAALKTPVIGLFGVAKPSMSMPNFDTELHSFIHTTLLDSKIYKEDEKHKNYDKLMEQIEANEVYTKILEKIDV